MVVLIVIFMESFYILICIFTRKRFFLPGVAYIRDLLATSAMKQYGCYLLDQKYPTRDRICPEVDPNSDRYWDEYIKHFTIPLYHPSGTCRIGAKGDNSAVVDPQLR